MIALCRIISNNIAFTDCCGSPSVTIIRRLVILLYFAFIIEALR